MTRQFKTILLALSGLHLMVIGYWAVSQLLNADGLVVSGSMHPIGGDFINLWTAGRMVLDGAAAGIYSPSTFSDFQQTIVSADIGHRVWAYPPHSLFLALPFGAMNYWVGLAAWSALGWAALALGAKRMGFGRAETVILLLSPASLMCVVYGQTANLAAGLLMVALTQKKEADGSSVAATTILTIKPQLGFMLPVLWALKRQWRLIALVSVAVFAVLCLSVLLFDLNSWRSYLLETLPELKGLELHGGGPFVLMIPSLFMALRILSVDGELALSIHLVFALAVLITCAWLIWRSHSEIQRQAVVLASMAVITPYVHFYDLSLLLIAGYLVTRLYSGSTRPSTRRLREYAVLLAWATPYLTVVGNGLGVPVTSLLMLWILAVIALAPQEAGRD